MELEEVTSGQRLEGGWQSAEGREKERKVQAEETATAAAPPRIKRAQSFLEFERGSVRFEGGAQGWFQRGNEGPDDERWGRST